jgi:glucose/arabinose dehydrogenase
VKIAKILLVGAGIILVAALLVVSGRASKILEQEATGPQPVIPKPSKRFIPTISIADAKGWPPGAKPIPASGLAVNAYASGLDHPRWLYVLPNGDVLVAETDAPPQPEEGGGIEGWIFKMALGRAGAATPSANRITLLRDADGQRGCGGSLVFGCLAARRHRSCGLGLPMRWLGQRIQSQHLAVGLKQELRQWKHWK